MFEVKHFGPFLLFSAKTAYIQAIPARFDLGYGTIAAFPK
jgi:hypothetical protein